MEQLTEEGILRYYTSRSIGSGNPILGAMGQLQFDVFVRRLKDEYNVNATLNTLPYTVCRWVKEESVADLPGGINMIQDKDGRTALMFEGDWEFNYFIRNNPDIELVENPDYA